MLKARAKIVVEKLFYSEQISLVVQMSSSRLELRSEDVHPTGKGPFVFRAGHRSDRSAAPLHPGVCGSKSLKPHQVKPQPAACPWHKCDGDHAAWLARHLAEPS